MLGKAVPLGVVFTLLWVIVLLLSFQTPVARRLVATQMECHRGGVDPGCSPRSPHGSPP
ncbi:unnamed protein product [Coffea canephora]|uniref:Uncharacterized protein n=1 Tax=Coffea canephora TaxID=49390 RepID=A0A068TYW4_COFCA|nr:unnamed protein product [Coffea canephora]